MHWPRRSRAHLAGLPPGQSMEMHMLGRTCLVGVGALDTPSFYRATVRVPSLAYRLSTTRLNQLRDDCPSYFREAQTRTALLMSHIAQRSFCIKYHSIDQQLVRWMLLMLDRLYDEFINVTHVELANLISCRREMITMALGNLAKQRVVTLRRGSIEVLDRPGLEMLSCDCYWKALGKAHPSVNR